MELLEFKLQDGGQLQTEVHLSEDNAHELPRDLSEVWKSADLIGINATSPAERGVAIGTQYRCALIQASINSRASILLPDLLVALVQQGKLTPQDAVTWTRQKTNYIEQGETLIELAPVLPNGLWSEIMETFSILEPQPTIPIPSMNREYQHYVESRSKDGWRIHCLAYLASHLPAPLQKQTVQEVLKEALNTEFFGWRTRVLDQIVPLLSEADLRNAIDMALALPPAHNIQLKFPRKEALLSLLPRLASVGYAEEAYDLAKMHLREWHFGKVYVRLASYLPPQKRADALQRALTDVQGSRSNFERYQVQSDVACELALMGQLSDAYSTVDRITDRKYRLFTLGRLLSAIPEEQKETELTRIEAQFDSEFFFGSVDQAFASLLAPEFIARQQFDTAIQLIESVAWDDYLPVLREVVPILLNSGYGQQFLQHIDDHIYPLKQYQAYSVLARFSSRPLAETALQRALEQKPTIEDKIDLAETLVHLANLLTDKDDRRGVAFAGVAVMKDYITRRGPDLIEFDELMPIISSTFSTLGSVIPEHVRWEITSRIINLMNEGKYLEPYPIPLVFRVWVLTWLLPHVNTEHRQAILQELTDFNEEVDDEEEQIDAFIDLARHLPEAEWASIIPPDFLPEVRAHMQLRTPHQRPDKEPYPIMDNEALKNLLEQACQTAKYGYRAQFLEQAMPSILAQSPQDQYDTWVELLHRLTRNRRRVDILSDLRVLSPLVLSVSGETGITELARAITEVGNAMV